MYYVNLATLYRIVGVRQSRKLLDANYNFNNCKIPSGFLDKYTKESFKLEVSLEATCIA